MRTVLGTTATCHNESCDRRACTRRADLSTSRGGEVWGKVAELAAARCCPPRPRDRSTVDGFASWLARADASALATPIPPPALHRLSRMNTPTRLGPAGVGVSIAALLPPDDSTYGFDNISDARDVAAASRLRDGGPEDQPRGDQRRHHPASLPIMPTRDARTITWTACAGDSGGMLAGSFRHGAYSSGCPSLGPGQRIRFVVSTGSCDRARHRRFGAIHGRRRRHIRRRPTPTRPGARRRDCA